MNTHKIIFYLFALLALTACGETNGPSLYTPTIIPSPGSGTSNPPKRIFLLSSNVASGNLTNGQANGILGADASCQADSKRTTLGMTTAKALIVDGTNRVACTTPNCAGGASEHTDWVLAGAMTYYQEDGTTVIGTTNASGVFIFPLTNSFGPTSSTGPWTGLLGDWTTASDTCNSWSSSSFVANGENGLASGTNDMSVANSSVSCGPSYYFYLVCVEQ